MSLPSKNADLYRRIRLYVFGFLLGLLAVKFLYKGKGCQMPSSNKMEELAWKARYHFAYSDDALQCLQCRNMNEAQLKLIKQKLDSNNVLKGGLDAFKKRYEDLQKLVESYAEHPIQLELADSHLNKWSADITGIKPAFMFYLDSYVTADKGVCKNRVIYVNNDLTRHADVTILLNNSNYKPSFEYQETFSVISSDQIGIYTDGTFTPNLLYLSYLRYPKYIDKEGYIKLDGSKSITQNCELKNYLEDELVDLTVECLAMYTDNPAAVQAAQARINSNE